MKNSIKFFATLLSAGFILCSVSVKAQSFEQGTSAINLGIGFGYSYDYGDDALPFGEQYNDIGTGISTTPVIGGSYEYGVTKLGPGTFSLGVAFNYQGSSYSNTDVGGTMSYKWTVLLFGVRPAYHLLLSGDKFDIYGALQLSYLDEIGSVNTTATQGYVTGNGTSSNSNSETSTSFYPYVVIGGRYFFTHNIGIWAEFGYSLAYLNVGLSLKFGGKSSGSGSEGKIKDNN